MVSTQKILTTLNDIKKLTSMELALFASNGKLIASTNGQGFVPEQAILEFMGIDAEEKQNSIYQFHKLFIENEAEYVLVTQGQMENGILIGRMAASQVRTLLLSYAETYDRNSFMQNVLLGNLILADLYSKAKRLHIEPKERVVYVIDTGRKNTDIVMEFVKNLSDMKSGDFVTSVDEHSVILIKDVSVIKEDLEEYLEDIAKSLVDSLHMEAMVKVRVGYGNVVQQIPDISQSYQEAKMALEVGRVFYAGLDTISYGRLGIGRLIYQLPMSLCEMFIKEVFGTKLPEILDDEEAMSTINKFFENNLNISETARQLYVHRNTLVYRLERIEKAIGLDIRSFDDAMTFRIAIMVLGHMKDKRQE